MLKRGRMSCCKLEKKYVSFPGADILFADTISDLRELPDLLLANEWDSSLRKIDLLNRIINRNIYNYLDLNVNKKVLSNIIGTVEFAKNSFSSIKNQKIVKLDDKKSDVWILLPSRQWFEIIHLYIESGYRQFAILPSYDIYGAVRYAIASKQKKIVFLPNYKVMYSSIRDFLRRELPEFNKDGSAPGALNRRYNMVRMRRFGYTTFSVVRNPWKRTVSAFMDKIGRADVRDNEKYFTLSIASLMKSDTVGFKDYVSFICSVPDTHSDPHWISQYGKIYSKDKCLVEYVFRFEEKDKLIQVLKEKTNLQWEKLQNTNPGPQTNQGDDNLYNAFPECYAMIKQRYINDIDKFGYKEG